MDDIKIKDFYFVLEVLFLAFPFNKKSFFFYEVFYEIFARECTYVYKISKWSFSISYKILFTFSLSVQSFIQIFDLILFQS